MQFVKLSTAVTKKLGPFLDEDDGKTTEEALAIGQADIRLSKNGGNFAQSNNAAGGTHDENGWYGIPLDTTDTNALGSLQVAIHEAGALPVFMEYLVVPANVYDSLISGTDVLQADLTQMGGVAQSATDLKDFADAGYDPATNKVQGVVTVDTTTTNTDMAGTDGAALAVVCTEGRLAELDAANIPSDVDDILADTNDLQSNGAKLSAQGKLDVNAEVVDVINVDTFAELGAGAPSATPTLVDAVMLLYMALRNKRDQSAILQNIYDDSDTVIAKAVAAAAGGTTTKQQFTAP